MPVSCDQLMSDLKELPKKKIGDFVLTLETGELPADVQEKALRELRESPEQQKESMAALQALLREEADLYTPLENEAWLVRFLRPTKYYPESALQLVKNYYGYKQKNKQLYEELLPTHEKKVFSHDLIMVLPKRDQDGRRILILSIGKKWKHKEVQLDEILRGAILFIEAAMLEPHTQVCGAVVILDMDGLSMQQAWQFTPPFAKRIVDLLQDCIALRVKAIHIVNQPYVFNMVFNLFKPFLREKLKSRLHFHGTDRKSLMGHIEPWVLPESYGGSLDVPPFHATVWWDMLAIADCEYKQINSYGYKKIGKK